MFFGEFQWFVLSWELLRLFQSGWDLTAFVHSSSQVLTRGDSLESADRFRVFKTKWNFWATWFGLFHSRTWNCVVGGGHPLRHSETQFQAMQLSKPASKVARESDTTFDYFSARDSKSTRLEFARTAQFFQSSTMTDCFSQQQEPWIIYQMKAQILRFLLI
jgi:hypothetical protein